MPTGRWLPETLIQATDRVEAKLEEPWPLERIADTASFSPFHFHRLFSEAMGETPKVFVERLRLERAALLLLAGQQPITDLAWELGFRNPETLARRFRARFGISARDYRGHQLEMWGRMGLEAGEDPIGGPGQIELQLLDPGPIEVRRQIGAEEGFVFAADSEPWCDNAAPAPDRELFGITLDWPGITEPGHLRQDWGRRLGRSGVSSGWVRRAPIAGLYATLAVPGPGPICNTVYQRLFVWALGGRHRLRPGPVVEIARGRDIVTCQPVLDTEEVCHACSNTR